MIQFFRRQRILNCALKFFALIVLLNLSSILISENKRRQNLLKLHLEFNYSQETTGQKNNHGLSSHCYKSFDTKSATFKEENDGENNDDERNKHPSCETQDWVLIKPDGVVLFNRDYLNLIGVRTSSVLCEYATINWKDDFSYSMDSWTKLDENDRLNADIEYFLVRCNKLQRMMIRKIKLSNDYLGAFARIFQPKSTSPSSSSSGTAAAANEKINVMMIGFDSISRDDWLIRLPKSSKFIIEKMNSAILNGYNILGDGTPAALIPMFTSKMDTELPDTLRSSENPTYCDQAYPFIWRNFSELLGYSTMYAEDSANIGVFQFRMIGMKNPPTLHYLRPFELAIDAYNLVNQKNLCLNGMEHLKMHLAYANDFMNTYKDRNGFFGFLFIKKYSHDSHDQLGWMDEILLKFLQDFTATSLKNNTMLMLFSDHGPRFGDLRTTTRGLLNERSPFFSIYLPDIFRKRYRSETRHLYNNQHKLTTPFDIHATLMHLLHLVSGKRYQSMPSSPLSPLSEKRSKSLFGSIPVSRSCPEAGIDIYWCSCLNRFEIAHDFNSNFNIFGYIFVQYFNRVLLRKYHRICETLEFKQINKIYLLESKINPEQQEILLKSIHAESDSRLLKPPSLEKNYQKFIIQFETAPNDAIYELDIDVEKNFKLNYLEYENDLYALMKMFNLNEKRISRLDKYGNTANCIFNLDPDLRKFCFCKQIKN